MPDDERPQQLQRARFRHPTTGEHTTGHIHAQGHMGATIVDDDGGTHKVQHGHYMHHVDKPETDGKAVKAQALKHLELGPTAPLATYAALVLLAAGGVEHPHDLKGQDVTVHGNVALIHSQRIRVRDKRLVAIIDHMAGLADDAGPLFQIKGQAVDPKEVDAYAARHGRPQQPGAQDMGKASAAVMTIQPVADADHTWIQGGYTCEWRSMGGVGMLTLRKATMPLPLHEVAMSKGAAYAMARKLVRELEAGKAPHRGVFRVDGR